MELLQLGYYRQLGGCQTGEQNEKDGSCDAGRRLTVEALAYFSGAVREPRTM